MIKKLLQKIIKKGVKKTHFLVLFLVLFLAPKKGSKKGSFLGPKKGGILGVFFDPQKWPPFFRAQNLTPQKIGSKSCQTGFSIFRFFAFFDMGGFFPYQNLGFFAVGGPPTAKKGPKSQKRGVFGPLFGPRKAAKSLFLGFLGGSVFGPFPFLVDFWALFGPKIDHFRAKNDPPKRPILTPFFDPFFGTFFGTKKGVKKWGLFWPFFGSKNQWLFARFLMTVFCVHFYRFLIEKSMNFSYFDQKILFRRRNAREDDGKKSSGPIFYKNEIQKTELMTDNL